MPVCKAFLLCVFDSGTLPWLLHFLLLGTLVVMLCKALLESEAQFLFLVEYSGYIFSHKDGKINFFLHNKWEFTSLDST